MDDIKFTGDGLQGRGGKGDVLIATIPTRVSASGSVETVAVKQLRLSDGIGEEKFLRVGPFAQRCVRTTHVLS